jgi:hypothetical protein
LEKKSSMRLIVVLLLSFIALTHKVQASEHSNEKKSVYQLSSEENKRVDEIKNFVLPSGIVSNRFSLQQVAFDSDIKELSNFDLFKINSEFNPSTISSGIRNTDFRWNVVHIKIYLLHQVFRI